MDRQTKFLLLIVFTLVTSVPMLFMGDILGGETPADYELAAFSGEKTTEAWPPISFDKPVEFTEAAAAQADWSGMNATQSLAYASQGVVLQAARFDGLSIQTEAFAGTLRNAGYTATAEGDRVYAERDFELSGTNSSNGLRERGMQQSVWLKCGNALFAVSLTGSSFVLEKGALNGIDARRVFLSVKCNA
jgi:hypothetical protein